MKKNAFELADRRFSNTDLAVIHVTRLENGIVRQCLDEVKQAFRTLDYSDDYQAQLGLGLFRIRCSLLFGLARYSHESLQLLKQGQELMAMAEPLPGSRDTIARLNKQLAQLLDTPNPKLDWIRQQDWEEGRAVIFTLMAMGRSFGSHLIAEEGGSRLAVIQSPGELGSGQYSTLVLPGSMRYLSYALSMKLLHRGEFSKIHVLLHESESLDLKKRYELPSSPLFPELSSRGDPEIEYSETGLQGCDDCQLLTKAPVREGNVQTSGPSARFLLFENGDELSVVESEHLHVWRPGSADGLMRIYPYQLMEGDYLVLEKTQRHDLLHLQEESADFRQGLDTTDVWRSPLNAMLLNQTPREVAALMLKTSYLHDGKSSSSVGDVAAPALRNLQINVLNWAEGRVFGPGDITHMRALVLILVESGDLEVNGSSDDAAGEWFSALEAIRAGRRAAGVNLSSQRDQLLKEFLKKQTELRDAEELVLSNGMVICIHKLAMVGNPVKVVPDALIKEPVRGALRWLE